MWYLAADEGGGSDCGWTEYAAFLLVAFTLKRLCLTSSSVSQSFLPYIQTNPNFPASIMLFLIELELLNTSEY